MLDAFLAIMKGEPVHYAFVHFHDPDGAGHKHNWGSPEYNEAVKKVDGYLGQLFELITTDPRLKGHTAVILSADHGGFGNNHQDQTNPLDYTIPFFVWERGVGKGRSLHPEPEERVKDPRHGPARLQRDAPADPQWRRRQSGPVAAGPAGDSRLADRSAAKIWAVGQQRSR